jgi:hypothetical protein
MLDNEQSMSTQMKNIGSTIAPNPHLHEQLKNASMTYCTKPLLQPENIN